MPYIDTCSRSQIENFIEYLSKYLNTTGDINYAVTRLIHKIILRKGLCYSNCSMVIAALQDAADEFKRTVLGPYEDKKRLENGPISELDSIKMEDVR